MKKNYYNALCCRIHTTLSLGLALLTCFILGNPLLSVARSANGNAASTAKLADMRSSKLLFTENRGQVADDKGNPRPDILFTTHSGNTGVYLTPTGIYYQFVHTTYPDGYIADPKKVKDEEKQAELEKQIKAETYRFSLTLAGANPNPVIRKEGKNILTENFYLPQCPNGITGVATYDRVVYENVYPHIDWVVYSNGSSLKYDFMVHPGGDAAQIKLSVKDAKGVSITKEGELLMQTTLGEVREQAPLSYANGKKIASSFKLNDDGTISFSIAATTGQELRIDPSVSWATYYGGTGNEGAYLGISPHCTTDANGNIYLMGNTTSTTGIASSSGYQPSAGGSADAFLVKFNAAGARIWATYYGGSLSDNFNDAAVDSRGNVYVGGITASTTGIATTGAFQTTPTSSSQNGMLVKFDSTGARLWGTYYAASAAGLNRVEACAVDTAGNVFITGESASTSGLSSTGAYQTTNAAGTAGILAKFNPAGARLWGTYYSAGTGSATVFGCSTDISGNVYIAMSTSVASTNLVSTGAYQTTSGGGGLEVVLAKFDGTGSRLWGTYYGGTGTDQPTGCATDTSGNVYITGVTASGSGIATTGALQTSIGGGNDAFIAKFSSTGGLVWGTYYGGSAADQGNDIAVDASGNVLVAGTTSSASGIYSGGFQASYAGGTDAMVVKLNTSGALQWASYFGGSNNETAGGIALSGGNVYLSGATTSSAGIATPGAYQTTQTIIGGVDDFLAKIGDVIPITITTGTITGSPFCAGRTVSVPYTITGIFNTGNVYTAQLSDSSGSFTNAVNIGTLTSTSAGTIAATIPASATGGINYRIRVIGNNPADTGTLNGANITVYAAVPMTTENDTICISQLPYTWNGKTIIAGGTAVAIDTMASVNGCDSVVTLNLVVKPQPTQPAAFTTSTATVCAGQNNIVYTVPNDATVTYNWSYSGTGVTIVPTGNTASVSFSTTATSGTLSVSATAINGCGISAPQTLAVTVNPLPNVIISQAAQPVCNNTSTIAVNFSGAVSTTSYNWITTRPAVGTLASGSGNILPFTAVNTGTVAIIDTIKVTPVANGCIGTMQIATITVKPTPSLTASPTLQTKCSGTANTAVTFIPTVAGTTYAWTNSMASIGIAASGVTSSIASVTLTNTTANPDTAVISITPTANLCVGTTKYDTIIVIPAPVVTLSPGIAVCPGGHDTLTAAGATTYSWSPSTYLSATTGASVVSTPAFTTTYTVTGTANGCSATATTTVSAIPVVTGLTVTPSTPAICNGAGVLLTASTVTALAQNFNAGAPGWTVINASYPSTTWTIVSSSHLASSSKTFYSKDGTPFYLADANSGGSGSLIDDILISPSFSLANMSTATLTWDNFLDRGSHELNDNIDVSINGGTTWTTVYTPGQDYAGGSSFTLITRTLNLNAFAGQNNVMIRFRYNTNWGYYWGIDNVSITGTPLVTWSPATAAFTNAAMTTPYTGSASNTVYVAPANTGNAPTTVTYTASIGTCNTTAQAVVTINPTPAVVVTPAMQTVCNNTLTIAIAENPTVTGTTYTWTNSMPAIGAAASGTGTVNSFTALNTSNAPDTATIMVTPIANGCTGTAQKAVIIVNPTPIVTITPDTITVCNNTSANMLFTSNLGATTTYAWTNSNSSIGLTPSGINNPLAFTAINSSNIPVSAIVTVIPTASGCPGSPVTAVINVTPSPVVSASPASQAICNGASTTPVTFTSTQPNTSYAWTNNNTPAIGLGASGITTIPTFTAINNNVAPDTAIVMVTPTAGTCVGAPAPVTIIINPSPTVVATPARQAVCNGGAVLPVTFTSTVSGNTFAWTNNNTTTGLAATGTANINTFTGINTGNTPDTSIITIIAAANACTSVPQMDTIIVYPTPSVVSSSSMLSVCNATPATISFSGAVSGTTYNWANTLTANGLSASGIGNIGFTAVHTGTTPDTAVVTVTPLANGCAGLPLYDTIVVRPTPLAHIVAAANPLFCPSDSVVIKANTGTGLTYQWQYNNTNINGATIDSFKANPAGSYTAIVTNIYNCPTVSNAVAVTHLPSPVPLITPAGATTFCLGDSVLLNANVATGITYFWKLNGVYISAATTPSYTATVSGNYTVYESDGTCSATSPVQVVIANQLPPAIITTTGPAFFCLGNTITLHADAGTTNTYTYQYQLNGANIPAGNTQNYTTATIGNYTIKVTSAANCSSTSSVFPVSYLPQPAANIVSGNAVTICSGDSAVVIANAGTGLSYQWLENGVGIPGATAISTFARTAGSYAVKVTGSNGCVDTSAPITVAVTASPAAIATAVGATTVCAPGTVLINANTASGLTYQWQRNGNTITGATNIAYSASATGSYSVNVSNGACAVSSLPVQVTIDPLPVDTLIVYAPRVICSGSTLLMQAALNAAFQYQWMLNGTAIPQATSAFYNATNPGTYTVNITSGSGCTVTTIPVQATTATSPTPVITYAGGQLCAQGYVNYQWYFDGVPLAGENNPCVNITRGGGYTVVVTNSTGCTGTSAVFTLFTGVGTVTPETVKLYPNPATTVVNISAPQSVNASLSSVDGKQIMYVEDARSIDISSLHNAMYMIKIYDKNMMLIKVEKLVKTSW